VIGAWDCGTVDFTLKPHAGRWESGTLNVGGVVALGASLALLLEAGVDAVAGRVLGLTDRLCAGARRAGLEVFSSRRPGDASGVVAVLPPPGRPPGELVRALRAAGVVVNHRAGRLRVSPHAYNTPEEVDRLLELLGGLT